MWYIPYETVSGQKIGNGFAVRPAGLPTEHTQLYTHPDGEPDWSVVDWDAALRHLVPKAPTGRTVLSQIEFSLRWTDAERHALHRARLDSDIPIDIRASLEDAERLVDRAKNGVDVAFEPTIDMVHGILAVLVYLQVIPESSRAVRATAILLPASA